MQKFRMLVLFGVQLCVLMSFASLASGYNGLVSENRPSSGINDARGALIIALIDKLAGAFNPSSSQYDEEFAQATKNDLRQLFISTRRLVQHEDFDQLVFGLDKILALNDNLDPSKNTLAKYLKTVLKGMAPLIEPEVLKGMLVSLASIDTSLIGGASGIVEGLDIMSTNNMYGQKRIQAEVNTSALRSLLIMLATADYTPTLVVNGQDTGIHILTLVDSPDHPFHEPGTVKAQTHNLAEWAVGEIVTAVRWGREGKIKVGGRYVFMDQFQAYDWLMFKKRYQISGHGYEPLTFEGVLSVASDRVAQNMVPAPLADAFPAVLELSGGLKEVDSKAGNNDHLRNSPWRTRYGTAGTRHKLFALATPLFEYFWNARDAQGRGRVGDLIRFVVSLNEIPCADYQALDSGIKATFRNDNRYSGKSVMKIVEDSGVLSAVLRRHGVDDMGLASPALDLFIRVIDKINTPHSVPDEYRRMNPAFDGDTLLDAVFAEITLFDSKTSAQMRYDAIDRSIDVFFLPLTGQTDSIVSKLEGIVHVVAQAARDKQFAAAFKADLHNLVDASQELLMSADLERIYKGLDMILELNDNPDPDKNTLARFTKKALSSLTANMDLDTIRGLIMVLATMDQSILQGENSVGEGIIQLMERNMYGQPRKSAEVKTCALRSLLFMLPIGNQEQHLELAGIDTGIVLLSMLDSPDHPDREPGTVKDQTTHTAEWAIGEIVTAVRWGREGKIRIDGNSVTLDQFQAYDWVMYKKRYTIKVAGLKLMTFNGLAGMLSNKLARFILPEVIADVFPAVFEVGGGMTDKEYAGGTYRGFTETSWQERYGTAGRRHKLLGVAVPLMEFCWNTRDALGRPRSRGLLQALSGLNEIPLPPDYVGLRKGFMKNPHATLRLDDRKGVLKTVQDSEILVYLLRARGGHDVMIPAMNLFTRTVAKLNEKDSAFDYQQAHPGFKGNTLMDVLFAELNIKGFEERFGARQDVTERAVAAFFTPPEGDADNVVAKVHHYIQRIICVMYGTERKAHDPSRY